jgi:hypothetical protein
LAGGGIERAAFVAAMEDVLDVYTRPHDPALPLEIPLDAPDCLTPAFAGDPAKQQQWSSFAADVAMRPGSRADVVIDLQKFLMPHALTARDLP